MRNWLFKYFEPLIQATITDRIVTFHEAMVERGQIPPLPPQDISPDKGLSLTVVENPDV